MSFQDDAVEPAPHRPTLLLYRCARCNGLQEVPSENAEADLIAAIDSGKVWAPHRCFDSARGVAQLIGTGPGTTWAERQETRAAQ